MEPATLSNARFVENHSGPSWKATTEELILELPVVEDGQLPLSELLSRVVQQFYAEITEFAETYLY